MRKVYLVILLVFLAGAVKAQVVYKMYMEVQESKADGGIVSIYGDVLWGVYKDTVAFLFPNNSHHDFVKVSGTDREAAEYDSRLSEYRKSHPGSIAIIARSLVLNDLYLIVWYGSKAGLIIWITNLHNLSPSYCLVLKLKQENEYGIHKEN